MAKSHSPAEFFLPSKFNCFSGQYVTEIYSDPELNYVEISGNLLRNFSGSIGSTMSTSSGYSTFSKQVSRSTNTSRKLSNPAAATNKKIFKSVGDLYYLSSQDKIEPISKTISKSTSDIQNIQVQENIYQNIPFPSYSDQLQPNNISRKNLLKTLSNQEDRNHPSYNVVLPVGPLLNSVGKNIVFPSVYGETRYKQKSFSDVSPYTPAVHSYRNHSKYPATHRANLTTNPAKYPATHGGNSTTNPAKYPVTNGENLTTHPAKYPATHGGNPTTNPAKYPATHGENPTTTPAKYPATHGANSTTNPAKYPATHVANSITNPAKYPATHGVNSTTNPSKYPATHGANSTTNPAKYPATHGGNLTTNPAKHPATRGVNSQINQSRTEDRHMTNSYKMPIQSLENSAQQNNVTHSEVSEVLKIKSFSKSTGLLLSNNSSKSSPVQKRAFRKLTPGIKSSKSQTTGFNRTRLPGDKPTLRVPGDKPTLRVPGDKPNPPTLRSLNGSPAENITQIQPMRNTIQVYKSEPAISLSNWSDTLYSEDYDDSKMNPGGLGSTQAPDQYQQSAKNEITLRSLLAEKEYDENISLQLDETDIRKLQILMECKR